MNSLLFSPCQKRRFLRAGNWKLCNSLTLALHAGAWSMDLCHWVGLRPFWMLVNLHDKELCNRPSDETPYQSSTGWKLKTKVQAGLFTLDSLIRNSHECQSSFLQPATVLSWPVFLHCAPLQSTPQNQTQSALCKPWLNQHRAEQSHPPKQEATFFFLRTCCKWKTSDHS